MLSISFLKGGGGGSGGGEQHARTGQRPQKGKTRSLSQSPGLSCDSQLWRDLEMSTPDNDAQKPGATQANTAVAQ